MTAAEVKLDYAYDAEAWHDLYLFLGAAAAALVSILRKHRPSANLKKMLRPE